MTKITAEELMVAASALQKIGEVQITAKTAYRIARNTIKIERELKILDKVRNALIKKYGTQGDNGDYRIDQTIEKVNADGNIIMEPGPIDSDGKIVLHPVHIFNPALINFTKEWEEVCTQDIELDISILKIDDLVDADNHVNIAPSLLKGIHFMLEE